MDNKAGTGCWSLWCVDSSCCQAVHPPWPCSGAWTAMLEWCLFHILSTYTICILIVVVREGEPPEGQRGQKWGWQSVLGWFAPTLWLVIVVLLVHFSLLRAFCLMTCSVCPNNIIPSTAHTINKAFLFPSYCYIGVLFGLEYASARCLSVFFTASPNYQCLGCWSFRRTQVKLI